MMAFSDNPGRDVISVHRRAIQASNLAIHHSLYFRCADPRVINPSPTLRLPRHLLYPTYEEVQILVDKFKYLLPKHLSSIMRPITMTDTLTPLFPSKSVEKCLIPWHNGVLARCRRALMLEEAHSVGFRLRYGLEEQFPTLVGSFCFGMRIWTGSRVLKSWSFGGDQRTLNIIIY